MSPPGASQSEERHGPTRRGQRLSPALDQATAEASGLDTPSGCPPTGSAS